MRTTSRYFITPKWLYAPALRKTTIKAVATLESAVEHILRTATLEPNGFDVDLPSERAVGILVAAVKAVNAHFDTVNATEKAWANRWA